CSHVHTAGQRQNPHLGGYGVRGTRPGTAGPAAVRHFDSGQAMTSLESCEDVQASVQLRVEQRQASHSRYGLASHGGVVRKSVVRFAVVMVLGFVTAASAQVKVLIDRNTGTSATGDFKFKNAPSPVRQNAAVRAKLSLVVGKQDPSGG